MKTRRFVSAALSPFLFQLSALVFVVFSCAGVDEPPKNNARKSVVVLGDSIAAGYGLEPGESFPAVLQKKIDALALPFTVVNAGVSGDTTAGGVRRLDWAWKAGPKILVVALGANDGLRGMSVDETKKNLEAIIREAQGRQCTVVLAGMRLPVNYGEAYRKAFARLYPDLAKTHGLTLIPFLLEGVGGRPELNQEDGFHPNREGQRHVAETVWQVLEPLL